MTERHLTRNRPQAWALWADDMYMSVPALAEPDRMSGQRNYFDDAVHDVLCLLAQLAQLA